MTCVNGQLKDTYSDTQTMLSARFTRSVSKERKVLHCACIVCVKYLDHLIKGLTMQPVHSLYTILMLGSDH